MASGSSLDRLARAIKRSNTSSSAWVPRPPQTTLHQGFVAGVDSFNGVLDFQFPDPSGLVVPAVRFIRPYTTDDPPIVGDVVWGLHHGTDFLVMGRHDVPGGTVVF